MRGFVRPSVRWSVGWLVGWSVHGDRVGKCENTHFRPCPPVRDWYWPCIQPCCITAPAQPSVAGLSCIRPCFRLTSWHLFGSSQCVFGPFFCVLVLVDFTPDLFQDPILFLGSRSSFWRLDFLSGISKEKLCFLFQFYSLVENKS